MAMSGMQLCLVNNDPISTLLITPDGEPLFSIETPSLQCPNPQISAQSRSGPSSQSVSAPAPRQRSPITTVKRLERFHRSTGHVETEIGTVEYAGPAKATHLQLREDNLHLDIPPRPRRTIVENGSVDEDEDETDEPENSWAFRGPDSRRYKWQIFVHSPVLLLDDHTFTPVARYRRAKLGIVSRSRRAFLEILPAGINLIDFIVVTFVGFMRQRLLLDEPASSAPSSSAKQEDTQVQESGPGLLSQNLVAPTKIKEPAAMASSS